MIRQYTSPRSKLAVAALSLFVILFGASQCTKLDDGVSPQDEELQAQLLIDEELLDDDLVLDDIVIEEVSADALLYDQLSGRAKPELVICIHNCLDIAHDALRDEARTHRTNVRACGGDPVCKRAERDRHRQAIRGILRDLHDCLEICFIAHGQGHGHGGDLDD